MGDDLYRADDLDRLARERHAILVAEHESPRRFGICDINDDGNVVAVRHGQEHVAGSEFVSTGAMMLTPEIFSEPVILGKSGEQSLPEMVMTLGQRKPVKAVYAKAWFPIGYPEDIARAEEWVRWQNIVIAT